MNDATDKYGELVSDRSGRSRSVVPRTVCAGQTGPVGGTFRDVPRISAFYGIIIAMYFDDHPPPHFHARYGEYEAQVAIATGEVINGDLPRRARSLVQEWSKIHHDELMSDWARAERQEPLHRIEPLP